MYVSYRNTKVKVRSPDGDTEYFDIVAGVLQGDTLAPYRLIICLDYVLRTSIDKIRENGFELTKKRSRRYPRNTKVKVRSPDGDTEYFDTVAGVLQGDTLAPYLFIICLDYVLRTSIDKIRENGFELTKKRSRRYPTKTITDADNADNIAILGNTLNQAKTLLHSLE